MRLSSFLHPELVVAGLKAVDNVDAVERLIDRLLTVQPGLDRRVLVGALLDREQQVSTGLESGVAVPHATVEGLEQTLLMVAQLEDGIDFGTLDGSPVRIVFMMLSPPGGIATHIRLLARIARLCSDEGFREALLSAGDSASLMEAIQREDARHV